MSIEVMKQALEALETCMYPQQKQIQAITSLRQAIEQAEKQEPDKLRHIEEGHCLLDVDERAWRLIVENRGGCRCYRSPPCFACSEPISEKEMNEVGYTYTTPQPKREWVGLTDEEIDALEKKSQNALHGIILAEAKLKEKNHG